jgi:hypothetical protein
LHPFDVSGAPTGLVQKLELLLRAHVRRLTHDLLRERVGVAAIVDAHRALAVGQVALVVDNVRARVAAAAAARAPRRARAVRELAASA